MFNYRMSEGEKREEAMFNYRMRRFVAAGLAGAAALSACLVSGFGVPASAATGHGGNKLVIGYSIPNISEPFWTSFTYGVQKEAKKLGVTVVIENAGGDANVSQQISQLQDLLQRRVNAVLVGATDAQGVVSAVNNLVRSGIPVIGVSSIPNSTELSALIVTDNTAMGIDEANCLGAALHDHGTVGALAGPAGQSWASARLAGFKSEIAKKYPGLKVIATSRLADTTEAGFTTMQDWVQRFPNMNGLYTATDDIADGALQALKAAHKSSVSVATANYAPGDAANISSGRFICSAAQRVVLQGIDAVKYGVAAATKHLKGKMHVVATPVTIINKANVHKLNYSQISAPAGYRP